MSIDGDTMVMGTQGIPSAYVFLRRATSALKRPRARHDWFGGSVSRPIRLGRRGLIKGIHQRVHVPPCDASSPPANGTADCTSELACGRASPRATRGTPCRAQRVREQRPVARDLARVHAPSQRRRRQLHGPAVERHHVSARVLRTRTPSAMTASSRGLRQVLRRIRAARQRRSGRLLRYPVPAHVRRPSSVRRRGHADGGGLHPASKRSLSSFGRPVRDVGGVDKDGIHPAPHPENHQSLSMIVDSRCAIITRLSAP